jgi:hypothetical protein
MIIIIKITRFSHTKSRGGDDIILHFSFYLISNSTHELMIRCGGGNFLDKCLKRSDTCQVQLPIEHDNIDKDTKKL